MPEEPIPIPQVRGRIAEKGFNLIEAACAQCGETFVRRMGTQEYILYKNAKKLRFCTWTCKCEWLRRNRPPKRGGCTMTAQERIDKKMRQMIDDRLLLDSEAAQSMTKKEIAAIKERMRRRAKEIRALEEETENAAVIHAGRASRDGSG